MRAIFCCEKEFVKEQKNCVSTGNRKEQEMLCKTERRKEDIGFQSVYVGIASAHNNSGGSRQVLMSIIDQIYNGNYYPAEDITPGQRSL